MKKNLLTFILVYFIILGLKAQESLVTESKISSIDNRIGLDNNLKWGFIGRYKGYYYYPFDGKNVSYSNKLLNGYLVEGDNGKLYTIFSDGTYKTGNHSDIETKTYMIPSSWEYLKRTLVYPTLYGKIRNYEIILKKNKKWGFYAPNNSKKYVWYPGNSTIDVKQSSNFKVIVQGFDNKFYELLPNGAYKLSDKKEFTYNKFKKLSGTFEGISTLYKRDKTGRYKKGKKLVKIDLYAFEDVIKNVKKPSLFFKVKIYKGKKGEKIEESFYVFKSGKDRELNRKQELLKNENNYSIKPYGRYLFNLDIKIENNQLTIKDDKNQLTGSYLRTGNLKDSSDLIKKGNLIMIDYFFKKYRYMNKGLNLSSYEKPRYSMGKRIKYNFDYDISLMEKDFFKIYRKDTLKLKLSSTNTKEEEYLIRDIIYKTFNQHYNFLQYLPNLKYITFNRSYDNPEYYMTIRDRKNPSSNSLDFTKETKIREKKRILEVVENAKKGYKEEVNSWFKLTEEYSKIRDVEKSLPTEEKINFKKFGVENYMFFENIYHGLFNSVGGFDPVDIKKAYVQYFVNSGKLFHLLEKPVGYKFTVNTISKNYLKTNTTESNTYNIIIDEKYANNINLFKEAATTTNGFRILFDLYKETQGSTTLFDDINTISRILPKHSKAHKRFQENFHRYIEYSYLKKNVKPLLTSERVSLNFPNVNENIKLQESKLVSHDGEDAQLFISAFSGKSSAFNNDKYNEFINDYKRQILRCTYYSKEYDIYYTLYFWKGEKPKINYSKYNTHYWTDKRIAPLEYISESAINMNIGKPVKTAPKNLKEAILKFYNQ